MSSQNATVLLTRLLSLRESSSFHLILDSVAQSSYYLVQEYFYHLRNTNIIYLSYETASKPKNVNEFLDCTVTPLTDVIQFVKNHTKSGVKNLVLVDSLNYIDNESLPQFLASLVNPDVVVVATYHTSCIAPYITYTNYPSSLSLLTYIATTIFDIQPSLSANVDHETLEKQVSKLCFPVNANLNSTKFELVLTNRRKSGRSITYRFDLDCENHEYEVLKKKSGSGAEAEDEEELLRDLTTFNLTTSEKQKLAREQVELPFMQAQEALGSAGGAIVYEFEKDDDYDEEDPYEDPF